MICPACRRDADELARSHAAGATVCLDCHLAAASPPVTGPQDAALGLLERHEARQERRRERILERAPPGVIDTLAAAYAARGLRPSVDADLELIRVDCPFCSGQDGDPRGMYRPVRVVPRARTTGGGKATGYVLHVLCESCHYRDEHTF